MPYGGKVSVSGLCCPVAGFAGLPCVLIRDGVLMACTWRIRARVSAILLLFALFAGLSCTCCRVQA